MEIKNYPPAGGGKNKKRIAALKIKLDRFLINYFNYFILALGLIILIAGLFVLAYPKYQQISKANEEAKKNLWIKHETRLNYLNSIRKFKKSYQSINDGDKAKIAGMIPAASDIGVIINEIEAIAARNSAILTSIKVESQDVGGATSAVAKPIENKELPAGVFNQPPKGVGLITIGISLSAVNYQILKNIIKTFENNLRLFDVTKISFNVSENKASLNIYSYYSPARAEPSQALGANLDIFSSDKFKNLRENIIIKKTPETGKQDPFKPN